MAVGILHFTCVIESFEWSIFTLSDRFLTNFRRSIQFCLEKLLDGVWFFNSLLQDRARIKREIFMKVMFKNAHFLYETTIAYKKPAHTHVKF